MNFEFNIGYYNSPIGILKILGKDDSIVSVQFSSNYGEENLSNIIIECKKQLQEYFNGKRQKFDLKINFIYGTEFQKRVWRALLDIPFGETVSYKQIACKIGNIKAVRAVGGANNKNPICIIVPCHRIIGANGKLVGYAEGLDIKKFLLDHESAIK